MVAMEATKNATKINKQNLESCQQDDANYSTTLLAHETSSKLLGSASKGTRNAFQATRALCVLTTPPKALVTLPLLRWYAKQRGSTPKRPSWPPLSLNSA
jgi:hypothetical protein